MKIKVFDESHEKDLEESINKFISEKNADIVDIKFAVSSIFLFTVSVSSFLVSFSF